MGKMPVSAEVIQKFPESVKLICNAGTDEDAGMRKS